MSTSAVSVLMVEDEKQIRRFVRTALEAEGYRVFDAQTAKEGLIEAATRKPDLEVAISTRPPISRRTKTAMASITSRIC